MVERSVSAVLSIGWLRCPAPPAPAACPPTGPLPFHKHLEQQNREHRAAEPDAARSHRLEPARQADPTKPTGRDDLRPAHRTAPTLADACPPPQIRTVVKVRFVRPPPAATASGRLFDLLA